MRRILKKLSSSMDLGASQSKMDLVRAIAKSTEHRRSQPRKGKIKDGSLIAHMCDLEADSIREEYPEAIIRRTTRRGSIGATKMTSEPIDIPSLSDEAFDDALHAILDMLTGLVRAKGKRSEQYKTLLSCAFGNTLIALHDTQFGSNRFAEVKAKATHALDMLCNEVEAFYEREKLWESLGSIGADIGHVRGIRQDLQGGMIFFSNNSAHCIRWSQYLSLAVDVNFQAATWVIAERHGGELKQAHIKSGRRMQLKCESDYKDCDAPTIAMNADMVRNCATFDDVDGLKAAYSDLVDRFGAPVSVKNAYKRNVDGQRTFGYRCILLVFLYGKDDKTWGELFDDLESSTDEHIRSQRDDIKAKHEHEVKSMGHEHMGPQLDVIRDEKATMLVEVQMILRPYLELRKKSHLLYKISRCCDWGQLQTEFN